MRAPQQFSYIIDCVPEPPDIFRFMQREGKISDEEAYGNLNMGAGFALVLPEIEIPRLLELSRSWPCGAFHAGWVVEGERRVVINPKNLEYRADSLQLR